jgi:anti-anti-sigma factor
MTPADTPALVLGPDLGIAQAAACRESLLAAVKGTTGALRLDLGGVTDIDSSALQLLLATEHSLQRQGRALQLVAASDAVHSALQVLGLQDRWQAAA